MNYCDQANACPALKANSFFSGWRLHIHQEFWLPFIPSYHILPAPQAATEVI